MSKSKGAYYERSLVKLFQQHGLEAWRVPLSGALGESDMSTLPDRVRKYLVGDVTVCIAGRDIPIEVKFRSDATGFSQVYRDALQVCDRDISRVSSRKLRSNSDIAAKSPSTQYDIRYCQYADCILIRGIPALIYHFGGLIDNPPTQISNMNTKLLNTTLTSWLDQCKVLALRSKRSKDWYFIII